ncbi:hypothetical protein LG409_06230 [Halomonas sp. NyZ770]|uniref:hypothetical protein n=1 Tax=Halomonas sp. NyZ770 TaxID=2883106 RepID=UPI001D0A28E3|nr:hypothetical protein [Halomonas sp. NyZ770]UDM08502.1 hypothetical protein LG409_06230 [Halomonas sp. NyZ770]
MSWSIRYVGDERSFARWGGVKDIYFSLDQFESVDSLVDGCYTIYESGALIDINVEAAGAGPLLVFFNGAKNREDSTKLPIFSGAKVTPSGKASRLSINDPALYLADDISMGWYAGTKTIALQKDIIPRIVSKVASLLSASKIVFVGGSAGGFASLFYASKFPDSICITSNPQTSIFRYYKSHVNRYLKYGFDVESVDAVRANSKLTRGTVTNLLKYYDGSLKNKTLYMQNQKDLHHVNRHYIPFLESLGVEPMLNAGAHQHNDHLVTCNGDWGDGHKTAPRAFWANVLNNVVENVNDIEDMFAHKRAADLFK